MHRLIPFIVLPAVLLVSQGCYHYRVIPPQPNPATEYQQKTAHALLWGLFEQNTTAFDCESNALDEVEVTTNVGYLLVAAVTVGIWVPMRIRWRCAKEEAQVADPFSTLHRQQDSSQPAPGTKAKTNGSTPNALDG